MWIARDENGNLWLYTLKPIKHISTFAPKYYNSFYTQISNVFYPEVTWENSPKELVIKKEDV